MNKKTVKNDITPQATAYTDEPAPSGALVNNIEIPAKTFTCEMIKHNFYSLCYDEQFEQAQWVAYTLDSVKAAGGVPRKEHFRADSAVPSGSAQLSDYSNSGYDRGQLCPGADMSFNPLSQDESFYLSNTAPMKSSFSTGSWARLEEKVREWAKTKEVLYIVTGGILRVGLKTTKPGSKVAVPDSFYKVILVNTAIEKFAIGFIMPAVNSKSPLSAFAVPVDVVEKTTGLDFFPELPDIAESAIEADVDLGKWGL